MAHQETQTLPQAIRMTEERRGYIGDGRYIDFHEGHVYVVGAPGSVTEFLADQFLGAGQAVALDLDTAQAAAPSGDGGQGTAPAPEPLAGLGMEELRTIARELGIEKVSSIKKKDDLIEAIETARAAKAAEAEAAAAEAAAQQGGEAGAPGAAGAGGDAPPPSAD